MAIPLADLICRAEISYPAAVEIARQMTAGAGHGDADLLSRSGINAVPAIELARQINAAAFDANLLASASWNPVVAVSIKKASGL